MTPAEILHQAEQFLDALRAVAAELLAETETAPGAATPGAETNPNPTA